MNLELADGRAIRMQSLEQALTYAGRLCGRGSTASNDERIAEYVADVRARLPWSGVPHVLPPVRRVIPARPERGITVGEELPRVMAMAEFRSDAPARDEDEVYSSALVIWFQDTFGLPDARAIEALRVMDWRAIAMDWTP